jgi:hypothetical protein
MTVGVGHRSLEAAPPEEDFATVLKEADGAFLANQNFHDVEARMTLAPDLPKPTCRRPPQSPLFPSIHCPVPFPADFRSPCLNLDEDEYFTLEDDEVEFIAPVPPIGRQASAALSPIILLGLPLPPGAETDGLGADLPPRS